jgi:DNA-binding phage protein
MSVKKISYQEYLIESLKDPEEAAGYLDAALQGGDNAVYLQALCNVARAKESITKSFNVSGK